MKHYIDKDKLKKSRYSLKTPMYLDKDDKRYEDQTRQLNEVGFSDSETWCLFAGIAEFILPRLRRFGDITPAYPLDGTHDEWIEKLDKMIFAFEWALADSEGTEAYFNAGDKEASDNWKKYEEGMELFAKNFTGLWW